MRFNLDQVVTEGCFDRFGDFTDLCRKSGLFELRDHHALMEIAEVAAIGAGTFVVRLGFREGSEVFAGQEPFPDLLRFGFGFVVGEFRFAGSRLHGSAFDPDQNVAGLEDLEFALVLVVVLLDVGVGDLHGLLEVLKHGAGKEVFALKRQLILNFGFIGDFALLGLFCEQLDLDELFGKLPFSGAPGHGLILSRKGVNQFVILSCGDFLIPNGQNNFCGVHGSGRRRGGGRWHCEVRRGHGFRRGRGLREDR